DSKTPLPLVHRPRISRGGRREYPSSPAGRGVVLPFVPTPHQRFLQEDATAFSPEGPIRAESFPTGSSPGGSIDRLHRQCRSPVHDVWRSPNAFLLPKGWSPLHKLQTAEFSNRAIPHSTTNYDSVQPEFRSRHHARLQPRIE